MSFNVCYEASDVNMPFKISETAASSPFSFSFAGNLYSSRAVANLLEEVFQSISFLLTVLVLIWT